MAVNYKDNYIYKIIQTTDSGYLVVGSCDSTIIGPGPVAIPPKSQGDVWVAKLDYNGKVLWEKLFGGSSFDFGTDAVETGDKGFLIVGETLSSDCDIINPKGDLDGWIIKISSSGSLIWSKNYGSNGDDDFNTIIKTADGNYMVAGRAGAANGDAVNIKHANDAWVVKINDSGTILWEKGYGGTLVEDAETITATKDGGYLLGCESTSADGDVAGNYGGIDLWALKIDDTGKIAWQKNYGGSFDELFSSVTESREGGYLFSGFAHSTDFDAVGAHGGGDALVIKTDDTGSIIWRRPFGGSQADAGGSAVELADTSYIIAGTTRSGDGDVSHNSGGADGWLLHFKRYDLTSSTTMVVRDAIKVYPTITTGIVNIEMPPGTQNIAISLSDMLGRTLMEKTNVDGEKQTLQFSALTPSVYLLRVVGNGFSYVYKIHYQ